MYYSKQKQLQPRVNYQGRDPIGLKKRKVSKMSSKLFHNGPPRKDKPKKCESSLCCKATAKLEEEVEEDMEKEDASLKELLDADIEIQSNE